MSVRAISTTALAVASLALVGCDDGSTGPNPTPPDPTVWAADLAPEGDFEVTGAASVEATEDDFAASIAIEQGTEGDVFHWYVGTGAACGEVDLRIGDAEDYPELEVDGDGEATAEATLDEVLDPDEEYHVAVFAPGEDEEEEDTLVACGELIVEN